MFKYLLVGVLALKRVGVVILSGVVNLQVQLCVIHFYGSVGSEKSRCVSTFRNNTLLVFRRYLCKE